MPDLRAVLHHSALYRLLQTIIGGRRARRRYINEHVRPKTGDKILDIGCGPGDILDFLPDVDYVGLDVSEAYIASAQAHYGTRGRFFCTTAGHFHLPEPGTYDFVIMNGVLHHLTDHEVGDVCHLACQALKPSGRFVSLDGCYVPEQSGFAKKMLDWDRGQFVRDQSAYLALLHPFFGHIKTVIEEHYFTVPYTLLILNASVPTSPTHQSSKSISQSFSL